MPNLRKTQERNEWQKETSGADNFSCVVGRKAYLAPYPLPEHTSPKGFWTNFGLGDGFDPLPLGRSSEEAFAEQNLIKNCE
jgi:hypothetical protein